MALPQLRRPTLPASLTSLPGWRQRRRALTALAAAGLVLLLRPWWPLVLLPCAALMVALPSVALRVRPLCVALMAGPPFADPKAAPTFAAERVGYRPTAAR